MHHRHLGGEVGQEQGFFHSGIAAAHHHHLLAAIEKTVAGGAGRDAKALELLLGLDAQPLGLGPGGNNHRLSQEHGPGIAGQAEGARRQVGADHHVIDQLGPHMLGLSAHLVHEPGALDHIRETRIVFHVGGDGQLAARLDSGDQHGVEQGARGIDGGGVAGGAGTDDGAADSAGFGHRTSGKQRSGLLCSD